MAIVVTPEPQEALPPPPSTHAPPAPPVTLADVERALGIRVGPFADLVVEQGLAPAQLQVGALRSSAQLGGWENLYALRRGVYAPGQHPTDPTGNGPVPGFDPRDRVRLVKTYLSESGTLEVDRDYFRNAVPGERLELHVLHPDWELRPAVLAGLERAFLFDRLPRCLENGDGDPLDLTVAYPWLHDRSQVWGVESDPPRRPGRRGACGAGGATPATAGTPCRRARTCCCASPAGTRGTARTARTAAQAPEACPTWPSSSGARPSPWSTGRSGSRGTSGRTTTS